MALEPTSRGAPRRLAANTRPAVKNTRVTHPRGKPSVRLPVASVGGRPVARGETRGMAVAVGDWRTIPAQTLWQPPKTGAARRQTAIPGPATICENHPSGRSRREAMH